MAGVLLAGGWATARAVWASARAQRVRVRVPQAAGRAAAPSEGRANWAASGARKSAQRRTAQSGALGADEKANEGKAELPMGRRAPQEPLAEQGTGRDM